MSSEPRWTKSSFSLNSGECVEVTRFVDGTIGVRDSKDPDGPVLRFSQGEINAFLNGVVAGEFDSFL
jgi:hypothetical protein